LVATKKAKTRKEFFALFALFAANPSSLVSAKPLA
jgi:hypothetical protein